MVSLLAAVAVRMVAWRLHALAGMRACSPLHVVRQAWRDGYRFWPACTASPAAPGAMDVWRERPPALPHDLGAESAGQCLHGYSCCHGCSSLEGGLAG